ncbi:hypothetical protein Tco_1155591 [Tanacetum coccineum]
MFESIEGVLFQAKSGLPLRENGKSICFTDLLPERSGKKKKILIVDVILVEIFGCRAEDLLSHDRRIACLNEVKQTVLELKVVRGDFGHNDGILVTRVITEYLVNISKRHAFWSLNEDILKINDADYQYAVSIKEDTATCLLFGHSLDDCPKAAPKRVDKCKGHIPRVDDEGFIEVNQKKSCVNYGGNKHFESVSVKPKTQYLPKAKQSTAGTCNSPMMAPLASTNKASISGYNKESPSNNGNGFSIRNLFEALNVDAPIIEEVAMGSKVTTTVTQEEGQCSVLIVEMINVLKKQIMAGKLVLVNDDGKPLEKVDYLYNSDNDDDVEPVKNETASLLASKGVGFGSKSLWEQWRDTSVNNEYDPYDDDMYESQEIP